MPSQYGLLERYGFGGPAVQPEKQDSIGAENKSNEDKPRYWGHDMHCLKPPTGGRRFATVFNGEVDWQSQNEHRSFPPRWQSGSGPPKRKHRCTECDSRGKTFSLAILPRRRGEMRLTDGSDALLPGGQHLERIEDGRRNVIERAIRELVDDPMELQIGNRQRVADDEPGSAVRGKELLEVTAPAGQRLLRKYLPHRHPTIGVRLA